MDSTHRPGRPWCEWSCRLGRTCCCCLALCHPPATLPHIDLRAWSQTGGGSLLLGLELGPHGDDTRFLPVRLLGMRR